MEETSPSTKRHFVNGANNDEPPPKRVKSLIKHFEKISSQDATLTEKKIPPTNSNNGNNSDLTKIHPANRQTDVSDQIDQQPAGLYC